MHLTNNLDLLDLCLYLKKQKILVLSDVHMGYEEALNKKGILVPRTQLLATTERLEKTLPKVKIDTLVITGDLKDEFGTISETEWRHTLRLLDLFSKYTQKIVLLRGNHDTVLSPIAQKRNLEVKDTYLVDGILFCHGDTIPVVTKEADLIVIGHEHPAVSLREGMRTETYKCFLYGDWKGKKLLVMPSFNLLTEGTDILKDEVLSPFLTGGLDTFQCFIVSDKIYDFGTVGKIKRL